MKCVTKLFLLCCVCKYSVIATQFLRIYPGTAEIQKGRIVRGPVEGEVVKYE